MKKNLLFLLILTLGFCSLKVSAQNPCNPIMVTDNTPWLDDFSTAPTCWSFPTDNINSSWMWDNVDYDIYHDYGTYESDAISPVLDISGVTLPYIKFSQKRADFAASEVADELYVYYRSTAVGGDSTWYLIGSYTEVCNDWFVDSIPLPHNQTTIQFKFHAVGNGTLADGINITFVNVYNEENAPSCIAPTAMNAFNIGDYSAELSWAMVSNGNVDLYYKAVSDSIYNLIETPMLIDGVFLLDNLETATQYVWYLDMDCGGESVQTPLHYFTTGCGLISTPHYEGFEFVNPGENPACWSTINSVAEGAYHFPGVGNIIGQYTHTGSHSYKFRNGNPQYAIMPEFDNVFSTLQVNFWTRREGSGSGTFYVGYVTDPQSDSSFVSLLTINGAQLDNSYYNYTVRYDSVQTVANTHYYIAFKYECTGTWFWYMDDISVTEITPCMTPESLNASNATGSSIDLSWTGNADEYTLYYRIVGETAYTQIDNVTLNANGVYTLGGLMPSTNYEWYVEAYCNDGTTVPSFIVASFTTECGAISVVPVNWDLEDNLTAGTTDYPLPTCWSRISASTISPTPYVYHQTSNAHSGSKSLRFYNRYPNSYAVLPAVDNTVLSFANLQISFYAKTTFTNAALSLEVGVMTNPEDASTFTTVGTITPTETYTLYEIPFLSYTGSGTYIAIRNVSSSTSFVYNYFHIDDISLTSVANCTAPINLTAVPSTHSATLSWVSSSSTFTLHYKEADNDIWQTENNVSLNSNNEYELTGLQDGTAYDWYVETSCGITPELESTHAYFSTIMEPVDLPYLTDFSNSQEWLMNNGHAGNYWMTGIPAGDTESALFITDDGSTAEYNTTLNAIITAEKAFNMPESNLVHVEFDVQVGGEGGYNPADYLKVFLAPNTTEFTVGATSSNAQSAAGYTTYAFNFNNYIWQTGELNYPYKLNLTQDSTLHISMNVANPDINGEAKIVFMWRNDDYLGTQPGAIIRNFIITGDTAYTPPTPPTPLSCNIPTNVTTANISHNSADVSWTAGEDETAWNLQYKESSTSTWGNSIPVAAPSYHLAGLNPETEYQVRIQANCIDTLSDWTEPVSFTTAPEVGIDNITLAQSISLMPNPADNYIELRVNSNIEVKEAIVYNAFGQMIQTVQLNDNHARIDLSNVAAGMYFVRVNGEGVSATKKFIKR